MAVEGAQATRRKLAQLRLGGLQKRLLETLSKLEPDAEEQPGMTAKELLGELHNFLWGGGSFWAPSIFAQLLYERGEVAKATALLLEHTLRLAERRRAQETYTSNDPQVAAHLERQRQEMDKALALIPGMQLSLKLHEDGVLSEGIVERLHSVALDLARSMLRGQTNHAQGLNRYIAGFTAAEIAQATAESNKRYASLSRAMRGLRDHGLIHEVTWQRGEWSRRERGYQITPEGRRRVTGGADTDLPF